MEITFRNVDGEAGSKQGRVRASIVVSVPSDMLMFFSNPLGFIIEGDFEMQAWLLVGIELHEGSYLLQRTSVI